jgi:hypothetical protein
MAMIAILLRIILWFGYETRGLIRSISLEHTNSAVWPLLQVLHCNRFVLARHMYRTDTMISVSSLMA